MLLDAACDKAPPARDAAGAAAVALGRGVCAAAGRLLLPLALAALDPMRRWQAREAALRVLGSLCDSAPRAVAARLPEIVPLIADLMNDPRDQVGLEFAA
jgi:hypothetical protein